MTKGTLKPWLSLGLPLGVLVFYTACNGVLRSDTYRLEAPSYAAQGIGQDYANLLFVLPSFMSSWWLTWKGSMRALWVYVGILSYLVYSYAMYAITIHFNHLFLMYTACFGLSLYSMVGILVNVDAGALRLLLTESFSRSKLRISLAAWLICISCLFYTLWLGEIVPHLMAGTVPPSITEIGLPSNLVHVLDLGIVLPLFFLTAIWVLQGHEAGFLFAPVLLTFGLFMMVAIIFMVISMHFAGHAESLKPAVMFITLFFVNLILDVLYLKRLPNDKLLLREMKRQ